ncbi:MAG: acyltransferase family protein [Deltaproteobacteria bacterium]|nr:acyltransferase family protein [Deltaproteobacteria bacterium]
MSSQPPEDRAKPAKPVGHASPGFLDGASIGRAASATIGLEFPDDEAVLSEHGSGVEGGGSSLVRALRGRLQHTRARAWLTALEQLLDPAQHREWIRRLRMRARSEEVDPFGLDPIYTERQRPYLEFLYRSYWRIAASGMDRVPDHGRAIIVANHGGVLPYDAVMLMYAIRYDHSAHRTARPLLEDAPMRLPFLGTALNRLGCVRASQENATKLLEGDRLVIVFPEGGKGTSKLHRQRYQLQRFGRGGFVKLALRTGAPIVPAAIIGAEEVHPLISKMRLGNRSLSPYLPITPTFPWFGPLGVIPFPAMWMIRFGESIDLRDHNKDAARDTALVNEVNDRVRTQIQAMLDDLVRERDARER